MREEYEEGEVPPDFLGDGKCSCCGEISWRDTGGFTGDGEAIYECTNCGTEAYGCD